MRAEILTQIATDKQCLSASRRISGYSELSDDLFAEMLEALCKLDEPRLIALHENKELLWYSVGVMVRMWQSTSSPFYLTFRRPLDNKCGNIDLASLREIIEEYDLEQDRDEQRAIEVAQEVVSEYKDSSNRKEWYDATLFELYMKSKSYKDASRCSKIPL